MTTVAITHNQQEGTLVDGITRQDTDAHAALKQAGDFRYSGRVGWHLRRSRDARAKRGVIDAAAGKLRDLGYTVEVDVDDTYDARAKVENAQQRAAERREARLRKAQGLDAVADQRRAAADRVANMIPLGQPTMPGHHSYSADVNRRAKMRRDFDKSMEAQDLAREQRRLAHVADVKASGKTPGQTVRKIERLEVDERDLARKLDRAGDNPDYADWKDRLETRLTDVRAELDVWREHLAELRERGERVFGPDEVQVGGFVNGDLIVRVNRKSVTIQPSVFPDSPGFQRRVGYDRITAATYEAPQGSDA